MDPQLTFFQRHFTKPISPDPEKIHHPDNRRFSFLSRGAFLVGAAMVLLLLGIIAAAVAVTFDNKHQTDDPTGDMIHTDPRSPIRLALLENFPDPTLVLKDGTYYAFATNNAAGIIDRPKNFTERELGVSNVQIATSKDFINWTLLDFERDPLPKVGEWVTHGVTKGKIQIPKSQVWAPGIIKRDTDNKYVMYYSANKHAEDNKTESARVPVKGRHPPPHCIGAAVSETDDPAGPYTPAPDLLACHLDQGGAIDAQPFRDTDGTLWIAYKIDGNNIGHGGSCGNTVAPIMPTPIKLQRMKPDGLTKDGEEITILDRIESDGPLVEAPVLAKSPEGIYFLFYSSGCTRAPTYDLKYATADTITGPYVRAAKPLLKTGTYGLLAPGSADVLADGNGGFDMVFHARVRAPQGGVRAMFTTKLRFEGREVQMVRANSTLEGGEVRT
ncbi:glycoside hydrolase family 43 protein [Hortaea werneckii]|nr:glycoside hydrolase family 43 protein [Hortaea werneckii]KAI7620818.1 glycoside hydrolase family 43 protein [Hortaea werneckii]